MLVAVNEEAVVEVEAEEAEGPRLLFEAVVVMVALSGTAFPGMEVASVVLLSPR